MTNYQQTVYDSLPDSLRSKYLAAIEKEAQKTEKLEAIATDMIAAMECGRRGENHWRLNQISTNTANKIASFMPPTPIHLLPEERRPFGVDLTDAYLDFETQTYGSGGAVRQG
jgi:hypothetical protein